MTQDPEEDKYVPLYDQEEWEQLRPSRPKRKRMDAEDGYTDEDRRVYTLDDDPVPSPRRRRTVNPKNESPDYSRDDRTVFTLDDDPEPPKRRRKTRRITEEEEMLQTVSASEKGRRSAGEKPSGRDPQVEGEPEEETDDPPRRNRFEDYVGQVLSGNILTRAEVRRHYPYVFFMAFLMFLYIANGYHIQKLHRRHDRLNAQIKELRSRSLTMTSIRMTTTRQSEIIKQLEAKGIPLKESLVAPKVVEK